MHDFEALLSRIRNGLDRGSLTEQAGADCLGEFIARHFRCSSVTVWSWTEAPGPRVLSRLGGFDATVAQPLNEPLELTALDDSEWYAALSAHGIYACTDTRADPRLDGLRATCIAPRRIGALLQAGFGVNGRLEGFISCTQHDTTRTWSTSELSQLKRIAAAISIRRARRLAAQIAAG